MRKVTSTETTYTFYGPGGILSEFTTSNAIATATAASSADRVFYHTTDKLGSAVLVMNSAGVVIENNRTLPYGEAWLAADFAASSTNDKKFETYQRDSESGLDYAMARFDASAAGRFLSPDPDGNSAEPKQPITLNRYLYVNDDPINLADPDGRYACGPSLCPGTDSGGVDISTICTGGGNTQDESSINYCKTLLAAQGGGGGGGDGGTSGPTIGPATPPPFQVKPPQPCIPLTWLQSAAAGILTFIANASGSTVGIGVGGSAGAGRGAFGPTASLSQQLVVSPGGQTAFVNTIGGNILGPTVGLGAVGGVQFTTATNASSPSALAGPFVNIGAGTGAGYGGGCFIR